MTNASKKMPQCQYCEDIIFIIGDSVSFSYKDAEQAQRAECEFFRLNLKK